MKEATPTYRIADLAVSERPRERLAQVGARNLSLSELLAILLRVGLSGENAVQVGQRLLDTFGGLGGLHSAPYEEICAQRGVGPAKAAQILAAIELGRRLSSLEPEERAAINSPSEAADLVRYDMGALEQEHLRVILLDTRNRLLGVVEVYRGSLNSLQVRDGELFRDAIRRNAASVIIAHNNPRGATRSM